MAGRGTARVLVTARPNLTSPIEQARRGLSFAITWGAIVAVAGLSYAARRRAALARTNARQD